MIIDGPCKRLAESGYMGAAFRGGNVVGKAAELFIKPRVVYQCKFSQDLIRAGLAVKDILIKGWLRAIDGSDKVLESILITETPDRGIAMAVLVPGRGPII